LNSTNHIVGQISDEFHTNFRRLAKEILGPTKFHEQDATFFEMSGKQPRKKQTQAQKGKKKPAPVAAPASEENTDEAGVI
jgi:hypothetical protein